MRGHDFQERPVVVARVFFFLSHIQLHGCMYRAVELAFIRTETELTECQQVKRRQGN